MKKISYKKILEHHLQILKQLQTKSGLFLASKKGLKTGYDKAWLRDNFYECLAFEFVGDYKTVIKTYKTILKVFLKHEYKIDWAIQEKPSHKHKYLHARYDPENFEEFWEEWGNKQNDSVGCILFRIGELHKKGIKIIENIDERRIVQKLVNYLQTLNYWEDKDSGVWEENEEVHASSVGACVAGLESIDGIEGIVVAKESIDKGKQTLAKLLPRESEKKFVDLALLSLIWPYDILTEKQTTQILANVEYHLLKKKGVIRYKGDHYYNKNPDGWSEEAEWTFGLSWLAIIYEKLGDKKKAKKYMNKATGTINDKGEIPELYFSNTKDYNDNSPLGWSESLFIVALYELTKKHFKR